MGQKFSIYISSLRKNISADDDTLLLDALQDAGIGLRSDCNRLGICGKCLVEISKGSQPPLEKNEESFLIQKNLDRSFRLACLFPVRSDLEIDIPDESFSRELNILKTGVNTHVALDPPIKKYVLQIPQITIAEPLSFVEVLQRSLKKPHLSISADVLKSTPQVQKAKKSVNQLTVVVHRDREIIAIEEDNTSNHCYGLAIDLGTTTLVVELVDLNSGKSIDIHTAKNNQVQFGADVVSRIGFSIADRSNPDKLRNTVLEQLNSMNKVIFSRNNIPSSSVYEIVLSGNTTMNHILLGLPLSSLSRTPFNALFYSMPELLACSCGFDINPGGKLFIVPNIRSFVGGDITSGLIASDLPNKKGNFLFIDLGTNGEIVLKTDKGSLATSTAAGPAFEGMNISCGMLALPGAIYKIKDLFPLKTETIQGQAALGICGTGLIDAVAVALGQGLISPKGKILDESGRIHILNDIFLSQKDIRELQLAVAAVRSGTRMIMEKKNLSIDALDGVYMAGAFGNYLNITNSIKIGLLPPLPEEKIHFVGNSSIAGAKALLVSDPLRRELDKFAKDIEFFSLATNKQFQEYFVDSIDFPAFS